MGEVFINQTPYLAPNIFSPKATLWHSHHGYMEQKDTPIAYKELDNINVSRSVVNGVPQIQILTSHKATLDQVLYKFLDENKDKVLGVLDSLHAKNKQILSQLLSQELQNKINLNTAKG